MLDRTQRQQAALYIVDCRSRNQYGVAGTIEMLLNEIDFQKKEIERQEKEIGELEEEKDEINTTLSIMLNSRECTINILRKKLASLEEKE